MRYSMRYITYSGIIGPLIAFVGIALAIFVNRDWWSLTNNAISDLGHINREYNYILNISLMLSATVTFPSIIYYAKSALENRKFVLLSGLILFAMAIVGLFLIGVFPEGSSLHGKVSYFFFYGGTFSMLIIGIGLGVEKCLLGHIIVIIIIVEIILAEYALMVFNGVAISEFIAAISIVSSYYLYLLFSENIRLYKQIAK